MPKLINAYRASPTLKNARNIRSYDQKHPFAFIMLPDADQDLVAAAIHQANHE